MMRAAILAVWAMGVLAAACGGGDSAEPTTATREVDDDVEPAPTTEPTAGAQANFDDVEFTAQYDIVMDLGNGLIEGTGIWYQASGNVRLDFVGTRDGVVNDIIFINDGSVEPSEFRYACAEVTEVCIEFEDDDFGFSSERPPLVEWKILVNMWHSLDADDYVNFVDATSTRVVAGEQTTCYALEADADADVDVCAAGSGVALWVSTGFGDGDVILLEAIDYDEAPVAASAFERPYPAIDEQFLPRDPRE